MKVNVFFSESGRPLHLVSHCAKKSRAGPTYMTQCGVTLREGWFPRDRHKVELSKLRQLDCPNCESIRQEL